MIKQFIKKWSKEIWISILTTIIIVGVTLYTSNNTSEDIQELKESIDLQTKLEHFPPQLLYDRNRIKIKNEIVPNGTQFNANMTVKPRSNHYLDIRVEDIILEEHRWDGCYFKSKPNFEHSGNWLARYDPKYDSVTSISIIQLGYEPYEEYYINQTITELSRLDVAYISYNVTVTDVQTHKKYSRLIPGSLTVDIPSDILNSDLSRCQMIHFN